MTNLKKKLGDLGERLTLNRLTETGYRLIETNWRCPTGEVDIIAWHEQCLTFVEVRTRRGNSTGTPEESITAIKSYRLQQLVAAYLEAHPHLLDKQGEPPPCRIDLAAVEFDHSGRLVRLQIHQNAVEGA